MARWEAALRAGEIDDGVRKEELKAVEKLEVLLKVRKAPTDSCRWCPDPLTSQHTTRHKMGIV